jgi:hypothetical protein
MGSSRKVSYFEFKLFVLFAVPGKVYDVEEFFLEDILKL